MTTIAGLPAHALLVHAIIVFTPLLALSTILCALWPAARRRLVWFVLALAAVNLALTPLTVEAGEWLYNRESQHSAILQTHAARGQWMIYFSAALLVVALAVAVLHRRESRPEKPRALATVAVAVLAIAVGVASIVGVARIGHTGTEAKWGVIAQ